MMKKRILSIFLSILTILLILPSFNLFAEAATDYSEDLRKKGFPESYISSLNKLKQAHPNWDFEVLRVGENFADSVAKERPSHSQQLIQNYSGNNGKGYYCTCSKCANNGTPKVMEAPNWVSASQKAVEYYLDPRNFLDEQHIFQFEQIFGNSGNTQEGVESILKGTWMYNANIVYKNTNGDTITYKQNNQTVKYSKAIMDAAKYSGLSAYYLAAKIVQEVGGAKATAAGASGTYKGYPGIYNYYNIGAYTGATDGLKWAAYTPSGSYVHTSSGTTVNLRSQPTTSSSVVASVPSGTSVKNYEYTAKQSDGYKWVKLTDISVGGKTYTGYIRSDLFVEKADSDTYYRPWTNPYRSIYNGAKWIANNFGSQYNGYLQKFNVNPASKYMHSNEYMANIQAAASEAVKTYTAYKNIGALNSTIKFSIPVFNNMPGEVLPTPKMNAAKVNSNGSFTLSWSAVTGADQYEIYLRNANGTYSLMKTTTATSYTTVVAGYGKQYTYKVRAVDSKNKLYSAASNAVSAVNDKIIVTPKMNAVTINANGSFTLSWNSVVGADKYEIHLKNADGTFSLMKTTTATSYTTVVASYGKQYTYKVRAVDSKKKVYSDFSNTVSAINDKKLTTPKMTAAVNANGRFTLSWSAVAGADQYEIHLRNANGTYSLMKTTADTSYTTVVATYGKQYTYKVRALDSHKNLYSEFSNTVSAVNNKAIPAPTFKAVVNANGRFTLSWNAVVGADKYEIYLKNADGTFSPMKTTTATSYTTVVATYGKQYTYKVRAVDSKKKVYSEFSNTVSAVNDKKMATPKMNATVNANGRFTLSWNAVAGADKYEIYYKSGNSSAYSPLKTVTDTSYTTVVAAYTKQYSYKVKAIDSKTNAESDFSNIVSAVNNKVIPAPTFKAVVNDNGRFTLSWNNTYGADRYEIYLKNADDSYSFMKALTGTSYTTVVATYGKQYTYKVRAVDSKKKVYSEFSNIVSAVNNKKMATPKMNTIIVNANGRFTLSWNAVTGADKYEIYVYNNKTREYQLNGTVAKTSATTAYAPYGVNYSYKVRALDSNNNVYSDFSNVVSAVNKVMLLTPEFNPVTVNDNGSFTLSWSSVAGADKYEIHLRNADGTYSLMKTTAGTSYTTVVAGYGKQYTYRVRAFDSKNKLYSELSDAVLAVNDKKMATPKMNTATVNANGSFTLSWNTVYGADTYEIYLKNADDNTYSLMKTTTDTSYTTVAASYTKEYFYKVKAIDSKTNAESDFSNIVSAVNDKAIPAPTNFNAVTNENGSFTLSWNSVLGADQYEIHLKNANGTYSLMKTTTDTSYTTVVATYGKQYAYKVRAVDSKKKLYSEFSNVVSAVNNKKMAAPKMNTTTVNANGSFTLSWNAVAGADKYEIYVYNNKAGEFQYNGAVAKTSATTASAPYGVEYLYKVRALDSNNNVYSEFSNTISAVNNKKLSTPTNVQLVVNSDDEKPSFTISWNAVSGADQYEVWLKKEDGTFYNLRTVTTTATTLYNPKKDKKYTYKIRAVDSKTNAVSDYSSTVDGVY